MSTPDKKHKDLTLEDLGLTPEEMETFASGAAFLFGPGEDADAPDDETGSDLQRKEDR